MHGDPKIDARQSKTGRRAGQKLIQTSQKLMHDDQKIDARRPKS
jgi:hypothetical protein